LENNEKGKFTEHRKQNDFWRTMRYPTPYWQFKAVMFIIILSTGLDVLTPTIIGSIIDLISNIESGSGLNFWNGGVAGPILLPIARSISITFGYETTLATLGIYVISLIFIAGGVALLNYVIRYGTAWYSQKGSYEMRKDMYASLLEQSFSFYDHQRTGQLMARATGDIDQVQRFYDFGIRQFISTILLVSLVIGTLFTMDRNLTLLTLLTLPFIFITMLDFGRKSFPVTQRMRQQYGDITSVFQENLMGIRVVRGFAQEAQEKRKAESELTKYFGSELLTAKYRAFYLPLASFISSIGFIFILWYGGNQVIAGVLSLGSLVAFYFYVLRISQPVRMFGMISNLILRSNAAAHRVFEIIDAGVAVKDKPNSINVDELDGSVKFENVSFGYDDHNLVLHNFHLDVKPGMTVAILGATGSGKSSVISLIPRFYDVSSGSIKIDGIDIRDFKVKSLRRNIGIVRQDPFIFSTSFRENIAYGVDNARIEDIESAATRAKIHDYIVSTPNGYDTEIGERGVTVSGGQKQRIAIARALLKNPKILILDDSTSSVDMQTEHEIQQALDELLKDRTTFIITQRLSSVKKADYIVVLEGGEIVEEGTHDKLLSINGAYRRLYETQLSGGIEVEVS
jgi:ABC-type multidrug transport system fused ATPase/permease subunit